jgi:PAS domain S-box-containing protein
MPPRSGPERRGDRLLDELFAADSAEGVASAGARALAEASGAPIAAVFLFDDEKPLVEAWHPADTGANQASAPLRALALERSSSVRGKGARTGARVIPLESHGERVGAVVLGGATGVRARNASFRRIVSALACRAALEIQTLKSRSIHDRYERWFRTLDEQLHVLDRERQKFAAIVHSSDAAVFVTDLTRAIRWTNSVMTNRRPADVASWVGRSCREACRQFTDRPEEPTCGSCPVASSIETNAVVHREYRDSRQETVRSLYMSVLPIRGVEGRPEEAMVMLQDLSDLEILRASEARYRLLFERSSRAIVMIDPATHRILLANPTASRMTGQVPATLHRLSLKDLHPQPEWRRLEPLYARAFGEGALEAHECQVRTHDGEPRVAVVTGMLTDFDGRDALMLEFRDVTETRRVEEALRLAEARLRSVVAASPIVLFALDREGIFTLSEGQGLKRLGLEPGQVVGMSAFEVYRGHPDILQNLKQALAGEERTGVVTVAGLDFETHYSPLREADGRVVGVIGVAIDVTERHRLEDQLRQAQRMEAIGRLAGGVAHDFNNLLAAMLGHSELMIGRLEAGHPLRRNVEEIQKAASRGAMLTRQLLAFGRKEMLSMRVLDVNAVVAGMEGMLQRLIGEDVELETFAATIPPAVRADRGQLEQVVLNLVVNARDAMPQGGKVTIEVHHAVLDETYAAQHPTVRPGPYVLLTVTDTGRGMDAETLQHVFEPFFTTKERGKGTGLGLATVYGIVEQCGGHVIAYSEPGVGSTFKVYLPPADVAAIELDDPVVLGPTPGGHETILFVEDEDAVRATAREVLESSGYHVIEARDGVEALELASQHPGEIQLLVSDVVMPRMGGGELAQKLTAARPGVRVLYISGYPDDALVRHGVVEHGSMLLQKPFALADFVRKVREVLDTPLRDAA